MNFEHLFSTHHTLEYVVKSLEKRELYAHHLINKYLITFLVYSCINTFT